MIPEATTAIRRKAVPTNSAVMRACRLKLLFANVVEFLLECQPINGCEWKREEEADPTFESDKGIAICSRYLFGASS